MKPKQWGPRASPEGLGKLRTAVATTSDLPYLTVSGPGFVGRRADGFRSVTTDAPLRFDLQDGWVSSSNGNTTPVTFVGAPGVGATFRKRAVFSGGATGTFAADGSIGDADGSGGMITDAWLRDKEPYRVYQLLRISRVGRKVQTLSETMSWTEAASRWTRGLIGSHNVSGTCEGLRITVNGTTTPFRDSGGLWRGAPTVCITYREDSVWRTVYQQIVSGDGVDGEFPNLCWIAPGVVAGVLVQNLATPPQVFTWNVFTRIATVADLPDDFRSTVLTDYHFNRNPPTPATPYPEGSNRQSFLSQEAIKNRGSVWGGAVPLAVGNNLMCLTLGGRFYDGVNGFSSRVALIRTDGVVVRFTDFPVSRNGSLLVRVIGRGAWVVDVFSNFSPSTRVATMGTMDYGVSYFDVPVPEGYVWGSFTATRPASIRRGVSAACLGTVGGDRKVFTTRDLSVFNERGRVASGVGNRDYTRLINVGTRDRPGPENPSYPWAASDRYSIPDWWEA